MNGEDGAVCRCVRLRQGSGRDGTASPRAEPRRTHTASVFPVGEHACGSEEPAGPELADCIVVGGRLDARAHGAPAPEAGQALRVARRPFGGDGGEKVPRE